MADASDDHIQTFGTKISELDYAGQAIWFLNAFWEDLDKPKETAEELWQVADEFKQVYDRENKGNSMHSLGQIGSAYLLEIRGKTMTAIARKNMLRDLDLDKDNMMSLWEYVIHLEANKAPFADHDAMWAVKELMTRDQGTNEALAKAKEALAAVSAALDDYKKQRAAVEKEIEDTKGKVVKHNRAKIKLEKLKNTNPLTDVKFNKEYITAEAAVKKAAKGENKTCQGAVWWNERVIKEAAKYRPKGKK